jgi:conjugal transfer pilus assembly protein TraK
MQHFNWQSVVTGLVLALAATTVPALQVIDAREQENVVARISLRELTRLKVENARIESIRVREGELAIEPDRERNEAFLRPLGGARNISVFVTTDRGTFNLQLTPEDVPSTTIILRVPRLYPAGAAGATDDYRHIVKQRLLAMMQGDATDASIEEIHRQTPLWKDTRYVLERSYRFEGFEGDVFTLINTGKSAIEMREREFTQANVAAVSIERLRLNPGESTHVYVLRRKAEESWQP